MSEFRFPDPSEREKRSKLLEMLDVGRVMVYVDPRHPDVDLPMHLRGQVAVPLNLSHRFDLQTFEVGPLAVKASLSFGGERYLCLLPYGAIFGLYGHEDETRIIFADALPPEVALVEEPGAAPADPAADTPTPEAIQASQTTEGEPPTEDAPRAPTLRLIE